MSLALALLLLLAPGPSLQGGSQPAAAGASAEDLLAAGQLEQALELLEERAEKHPEDAAAQRDLALALERLVDQGGSWLALVDARAAWERALALEPLDLETLRAAIRVRLRLGEHQPAAELAARAVGSAWLSRGTLDPGLLVLVCRARIGAFRAAEHAGAVQRAEAAARLVGELEHARSLQPRDGELALVVAAFLEEEGLPERALAVLVACLEQPPAGERGEALHRALIDLHVRHGIEERLPALYERWSQGGTSALLSWYAGYVWRLAGDVAQRERRFADALAAYARASDWLRTSGALEPDYRATVETLLQQVEVSSGWCELESGALDRARARLLALLDEEPARRDELDGLGRSLLHALAALGQRQVERGDLAEALELAREVTAEVPGDGSWWNNLGFLLRERATQVDAGLVADAEPREHRARELYRESWQAYLRAAELLPADPRVLNDAALVQVYHLRDELARAERMLEGAIELAREALRALGEDAPEAQRFPLAQALGDAYLNLGYLCYHIYRQPLRARECFERSRATDSGARPELAAYLAALDESGPAVPEPDRRRFLAPPAPETPGRLPLAAEASLAEARERAREEGRALLVYNRGEALGLAVPALDAWLASPEFARRCAEAVLVVCDRERLTFVDRRRDGRRVPCPRWAPLTCTEHRSAADEFARWFQERCARAPGGSEEGLFLQLPGQDELVQLASLDGLELPAGQAELAAAPFEAVEASLGGGDGGGEARALVAQRGQAARETIERILWEGFRSSPARGHLLRALAEDARPAAREQLAACVRQGDDPELARAALEVWPAGAELDPVEHALRWSADPDVRAAAASVLARERPDDAALALRARLELE